MTTKATDWVWEKTTKIDGVVGDFQFDLVERTSRPFPKAYRGTARPFSWSFDRIADGNEATRDALRSARKRLPHPVVHARAVYKRPSRARRFVGLGECAVMSATRLVGNVACFTAHTARVGVAAVGYTAVALPLALAWVGISAAWVATVAVPTIVIGVVARAPLYVAAAASTVVLEAPGVARRAAGLPVKFARAAFDMVWNGDASARSVDGGADRKVHPDARPTEVKPPEAKTPEAKGKSELRHTRAAGRERGRFGRLNLKGLSQKRAQGPDRGDLGR